jgi:transcriptional regulator with XRE-family HTH domain
MNIPEAIKEFRKAGWTVRQIADDLRVHVSTVYRWQAGTRRPNAANFAALVEAVDMQYGRENCRRRPRPLVLMHLEAAHTALEDPAEREAFEADMKARYEAIRAENQPEPAPASQPRRSAFADCDPFTIFGRPEPALPF